MDKNTLDKINALTRRKFKAEELYTFPVVLCHNDVDRDYERFSDDALDEMAKLYVGTTIIENHDPDTKNQVARLYDTEVISEPETLTKDGRPYRYLKGYAYMVRTDSNADLITAREHMSRICAASSHPSSGRSGAGRSLPAGRATPEA